MRLTIIRADNAVYIDGKMFEIDCSGIDQSLHAVQWHDVSGWKEFVQPFTGEAILNESISSIDEFQSIIDAWYFLKQKENDAIAAKEAAKSAAEQQQAQVVTP